MAYDHWYSTEGHARAHSQRSPSILVRTAAQGIIISILLGITFILVMHQPQLPWKALGKETRDCSCGNSSTEAAARGCKFDVFALAWLPDECRDDELITHLTRLGEQRGSNWTFFTFPDPSRELSITEVASLAGPRGVDPGMVTTTIDWHHTHCLYISLQHFRSQKTGKRIAPRYGGEKHITHCTESVLGWIWEMSPAYMAKAASQVDVYPD